LLPGVHDEDEGGAEDEDERGQAGRHGADHMLNLPVTLIEVSG
jgi:hypothetical protein